jgi:hypothetical protein
MVDRALCPAPPRRPFGLCFAQAVSFHSAEHVLNSGGAFADAAAEQTRNRDWLREHAGW